jgi:hypothetical protein
MASRTTKITEIRTDVITSYHMNIGKKKRGRNTLSSYSYIKK